MQHEPFFTVVANGWDHDGWQGSFYPDDLPREWRLSYYASEFAAVLVPATLWTTATDDEVASWAEDTVTAFRFFLGWEGADIEQEALARVVGLLRGKCAGVLGTGSTRISTSVSTGFFLPDLPATAVLRQLAERRAGACWPAESGYFRCAATGLRSVRLCSAVDVRRLRDLVQLLAEGERGGVLVVEGTPPQLETLNAAATIAALLGV